jgi:uncharacterized membrane protein YbhN (UPF0104 family)
LFKTKKNQRILFTAVKLIFFAAVLILLYFQFKGYDLSQSDVAVYFPWLIVLASALVFPNMLCVFLIWKASLIKARVEYTRRQLIHSFFAGLLTGLLTPNMAGNFIGRMYYFDPQYRTVLVGLTIYGNQAHFIASLLFGLLSLLAIHPNLWMDSFELIKWPAIALAVFAVLIYLFPHRIIPRNWTKWRLNELKDLLRDSGKIGLVFLLYSAIRFVIFSFQFFLVLVALGAPASLSLIFHIWLIYLLTLMAPSLILGKLGVKESISVFVLTTLGIDPFIILFASLYIWLINTFAPAFLGLLITKDRSIT